MTAKYTTLKAPAGVADVRAARTFTAAVASAVDGVTQEQVAQLLYKTAGDSGYLPFAATTVNKCVEALGFSRIKRKYWSSDPNAFILSRFQANANSILLIRSGSGRYAVYSVLLPAADGFEIRSMYPALPNDYGISVLYEADVKSLATAITTCKEKPSESGPKRKPTYSIPENTDCFRYFQPNPYSRNTGDCVIRAFCAVLAQPYDVVAAKIGESLSGCIDFNYYGNYLNLLLDEGFGRIPIPLPPKKSTMNGQELCAWLEQTYPDGNARVYVLLPSHAVGVLPYQGDDGRIHYAYNDSWNSTTRNIEHIFLLAEDTTAVPATPATELTLVEVGTRLMHPAFGPGSVTSVTPLTDNAIVSIAFDSGEAKRLMMDWVLSNCQAAG